MIDRSGPIGVFDSGLGGLTVLRALRQALPEESFTYFADTARLPYGVKTGETIQGYARAVAQYLCQTGIKCLVVACNTVCAHAMPQLVAWCAPVPVIGVLGSSIAEIVADPAPLRRVAVLATESTVHSQIHTRLLQALRPEVTVQECSANLLVALVEEGWLGGPLVEAIVQTQLAGLLEPDRIPDLVVLGCTHFPVLAPVIQSVLPSGVVVLDPAYRTAQEVCAILDAQDLHVGPNATATLRFLVTEGVRRLSQVGTQILATAIEPFMVEWVDAGSIHTR